MGIKSKGINRELVEQATGIRLLETTTQEKRH